MTIQPAFASYPRIVVIRLCRASSKKLVLPNGDAWSPPKRFIDAIGTELRFGALTALVAAHPSVVSRYKSYRDKFNHLQIAKRTLELARIS